MNGSPKSCRVDPDWRHESPQNGESPPIKNGLNPHSDEAQSRPNPSIAPADSSYRHFARKGRHDGSRSPSSYEYTRGAVNDHRTLTPAAWRSKSKHHGLLGRATYGRINILGARSMSSENSAVPQAIRSFSGSYPSGEARSGPPGRRVEWDASRRPFVRSPSSVAPRGGHRTSRCRIG